MTRLEDVLAGSEDSLVLIEDPALLEGGVDDGSIAGSGEMKGAVGGSEGSLISTVEVAVGAGIEFGGRVEEALN